MPGSKPKIDRDDLHQLLWERTDSRGTVRVILEDLAEDLGISKRQMTRIMAEMDETGRISKVKRFKYEGVLWRVHPPDGEDPVKARPRQPLWG